MRRLVASVALAAVAWALGVAAQYRGEVEVQAVVAPVTVYTESGRVVDDVPQSRFELFVDGFPVPIRDFDREADLPLSLGFILDTSGSMDGRKLRACQQLITAFLAERRPEDELSLWTFADERVQERFPFGMGWYLLPRVLETLRPWSTTALYDMVQRVPDVMERAEHPRRAAILLTDGVDNDSEIGADEAEQIARRLQTPIYALGVEPPPVPQGSPGPSYEDVLIEITDSSGGSYRRIPRTEDMPTVARTLLGELSSRFIITFATSGIGERRWRTIEVKVDGYRAVTRSGYIGTLP